MSLLLHHFFVLASPDAAEAELLTGIGMVEGTRNDHPGQGTANRRFFFADTYFELVYIRDRDEALHGRASRLAFVERIDDPGASPFGLVFRETNDKRREPFAGWRYYPEYFADDQYFLVGENSTNREEPLCICLPSTLPARAWRDESQEPFSRLTALRVSVPVARFSPVLERVSRCDRLSLTPGKSHHMEIVFDEARLGQARDLRPQLPVTVRW